MSMIKYRVHEVAKDFGLPTKSVTQILTDYIAPPKNHMQVLETNELDVIFEYITQHNQVLQLRRRKRPLSRPRRPRRRISRMCRVRSRKNASLIREAAPR